MIAYRSEKTVMPSTRRGRQALLWLGKTSFEVQAGGDIAMSELDGLINNVSGYQSTSLPLTQLSVDAVMGEK